QRGWGVEPAAPVWVGLLPGPENGGYRCRPSPCQGLPHNTVIEYFCDEGFALKGGEKFRTCQDGEWDHSLQISCRPAPDKEPGSPLGVPTLTVVASTASCVALILLLVVLFVLVQPRLKSFHHSRRGQGVSGQPCSIMVGGVQVSLPSYEEAVHGTGGPCSAQTPDPVSGEVPRRAVGGQVCGSTHQHSDPDDSVPSTSFSYLGQTETVLLHRAPSASPGNPPQGASAGPLPSRRGSGDGDQQSLLSATSAEEFSDDVPLLKDA
uniref:Sushi domain containing 6 n=1 Tax=Oryzias melastigma TaxID=30732 RepID=A0A3B3CLZ3_ORYME